MSNVRKKLLKTKPCPTCGKAATNDARPFCSKRCANIDLGRWFQGAYAVPAVDGADDSILDTEFIDNSKSQQSDPSDNLD